MLYRNEKDKIDLKINEVNSKLHEFELLQQEYDLIDDTLGDGDEQEESNNSPPMSNQNLDLQKLKTFGNDSAVYTDRNNRYSVTDNAEANQRENKIRNNDVNVYNAPKTSA